MTCEVFDGTIQMPDGSVVSYDGLPVNQFNVQFSKIPNTIFFLQSWNVPSITLGQTERATPELIINEIGERIDYSPFQIEFLIDKNMKNYKEIFDWMKRISASPNQADEVGDATIFVGSSRIIRFVDCWPSILGGVEFRTNVETGDIKYMTNTCTFAYDYYEFL